MACVDYTLLQGGATPATWLDASSWDGSTVQPGEAFDGSSDGAGGTTNCWINNSGNPPNVDGSLYLEFNFPTQKKLRCFRFNCVESDGMRDPCWPHTVKWIAKASGDTWGVSDSTVFAAAALSGVTALAPGDWTSWFEFDSPDSYDDYRLEIHLRYNYTEATTSNGTGDVYAGIQEIEFYEEITPLSFDNFGSTPYINQPIVPNFGNSSGIQFPFGYPYSLSDPLTLAATLVMRAFNLESYFGIQTFMSLNAFDINSVISKVIDSQGSLALKGLEISAAIGKGRLVNATFTLPGFRFNATMTKDQLVTGALTLKAMTLDAVAYQVSTAAGTFTLTPLELRSRGLQDLDYFVMRYTR